MKKGPSKKPTNPGAGETHEVKGTSPEKREKDQKKMDELLSGLPGYEPKSPEAKKGKEAVKKRKEKLKKGTKEYKDKLAQLTDIKIDKGKDKLSQVKIAGSETTPEEIAGKGAQTEGPDEAVAKKAQKPGTKKREDLS
jgi:hypothetical protein